MQQTTLLTRKQPARQEFLQAGVITRLLKDLLAERQRWYSYYRPGTEILDNLHQAAYQLQLASLEKDIVPELKICLRLELIFHCLADRRSPRRLQSYLTRLNMIMNACREELGLIRQF